MPFLQLSVTKSCDMSCGPCFGLPRTLFFQKAMNVMTTEVHRAPEFSPQDVVRPCEDLLRKQPCAIIFNLILFSL